MRRLLLFCLGAWGCTEGPPPGGPSAPDLGGAAFFDAELADVEVPPVDAGTPDLGPGDSGSPGQLSGPMQVALPFVLAGAGGTSAAVTLLNLGDAELSDLVLQISNGPFTIEAPPGRISGQDQATLLVRHPGGARPAIDAARLEVRSGASTWTIELHAVIGDPDLPEATWEEVSLAQNQVAGRGATVRLPSAPFPAPGRSWSDDRVHIFVPDNYPTDRAINLLLHFHGFGTTLADTLVAHRYREQVYASGAAAVLVVPQGPVSAQSGDFGKLMSPAGTAALLEHVRMLLYRDGLNLNPTRGELYLSAHSGGYQAVAANLDPTLEVAGVELFDALYGERATFRGFVRANGRLRSNYSQSGGTLAQNQALRDELLALGLSVDERGSGHGLRDAAAVITFAPTTHNLVTRYRGAYGEWLRYLAPGRRGPRPELLSVLPIASQASLHWRAPADPAVIGWRVERGDRGQWAVAADVAAELDRAEVPLGGGGQFRVRALLLGDAETTPSDTYRADPDPGALIVDGFDRIIGGGYSGLAHDFAARVAEVWGPAATIGHRALDEGTVQLEGWPLVLWLAGDQSRDDLSVSPAEAAAVRAYLEGGGRFLVSGSEVAYDLVARDPNFLAQLGASYLADSNPAREVSGAGALAGLGSFSFGGPGAPYAVGYPDVLGTTAASEVVLRYPDGQAAAVGIPGQTVVLGFPIETLDDPEALRRLLAALRQFLGG
ncbi:MAG: hypothetical protein IPG45_18525 [Deltaproteobacteria bacterium]|nr:hypothetical protein [Deltaproteobacteria bacterium]